MNTICLFYTTLPKSAESEEYQEVPWPPRIRGEELTHGSPLTMDPRWLYSRSFSCLGVCTETDEAHTECRNRTAECSYIRPQDLSHRVNNRATPLPRRCHLFIQNLTHRHTSERIRQKPSKKQTRNRRNHQTQPAHPHPSHHIHTSIPIFARIYRDPPLPWSYLTLSGSGMEVLLTEEKEPGTLASVILFKFAVCFRP